MKVAQIIDSLEAGGAERMAVHTANGLVTKHIFSALICTRKEGFLKEELNKDVAYLFLKRQKTLDQHSLKTAIHFIKKHKITHLHAHASSFFFATQIKLLQPRLKLIWHIHFNNLKLSKAQNASIILCKPFINNTITVNQTLENWALSKKIKTTYIANCVTKSETTNGNDGLKGEKGKRMICLANLRQEKNQLGLIKAFYASTLFKENWTLHLVGKKFQDEYEMQLLKLIENLNLTEKVFLYGSRKDSFQLLSQSDLGVLSSKTEGLPLAILEYGLAKLPVIATNVGQIPSLNSNDNFFHTTTAIDSELTQALNLFLQQQKDFENKALAWHKEVIDKYGINTYINHVIATYQKS